MVSQLGFQGPTARGYMSFLQPTPSCIGWWRIWSCSAGAGGLASYATIAVPSVAMYGFDWWAYETWSGRVKRDEREVGLSECLD